MKCYKCAVLTYEDVEWSQKRGFGPGENELVGRLRGTAFVATACLPNDPPYPGCPRCNGQDDHYVSWQILQSLQAQVNEANRLADLAAINQSNKVQQSLPPRKYVGFVSPRAGTVHVSVSGSSTFGGASAYLNSRVVGIDGDRIRDTDEWLIRIGLASGEVYTTTLYGMEASRLFHQQGSLFRELLDVCKTLCTRS